MVEVEEEVEDEDFAPDFFLEELECFLEEAEADEEVFLEELFEVLLVELLEEAFFLEEEPEEDLEDEDLEEEDLPEEARELPWCALRMRSFFSCSLSSARRLRIPIPESIRKIRSSLKGVAEWNTPMRLPAGSRRSSGGGTLSRAFPIQCLDEIEPLGGCHCGRRPRVSRGQSFCKSLAGILALGDANHSPDKHPDHPVEEAITFKRE